MAEPGFKLLKAEGEAVLPGDRIGEVAEAEDGKPLAVVRFGPGVRWEGSWILAARPGLVCAQMDRSRIWIDSAGRRYIPAREDMVIGIVSDRHGEGYRVDIGAHEPAQLGHLSFEGATKRNRPYLKIGAVVYARVVNAEKDFEPEISCILPGSNKSWISGESLFGELAVGGQIISVSLSAARALLKPSCQVLTALGEIIPKGFECVVGANGRVFVRASTPRDTILVTSAIRLAETGGLGDDIVSGVRKLISA